jgi:hypothetical protein
MLRVFSSTQFRLLRKYALCFSGLVTSTIPMYLTEIAPLSIRGAMGVLCPLGITVGVLVAQVLGLESVLGKCLIIPPISYMFGMKYTPNNHPFHIILHQFYSHITILTYFINILA